MGLYFEQFTPGQTYRTSGRTITEADIGAFAGLTGDYNPVHTDVVFAAASPFGTRIAHGPFGIGLAFGLASRLDLIDGTVIALLSVQWDFRAPVQAGDTLHAAIAVAEARPTRQADRGIVGLSIEMINQDDVVTQAGSLPAVDDAAARRGLSRVWLYLHQQRPTLHDLAHRAMHGADAASGLGRK